MNITILGCGRWGTFLAQYLNKIGHNIMLWGRESSKNMKILSTNNRKNNYLTLNEKIELSTSLKDALIHSQYIIFAVNPHTIQGLLNQIYLEKYFNKTFIICMKGFSSNGERITELFDKYFTNNIKTACLFGPGQPQNLLNDIPTCLIVDSKDKKVKYKVADIFESNLISIEIGEDLIGNEISSAAKNVLGIAAGILDAMKLSPLIGPLIVYGLAELSELVLLSGGKKETVYGLSCLGDVEASFFSKYSRSKIAGKSIVNNENIDEFTPGIYTSKTILNIAEKHQISLPLFSAINKIIEKEIPPSHLKYQIIKYKNNL